MFSFWKKTPAPLAAANDNAAQADAYLGERTITALLNSDFNKNFLTTINQNITTNTSVSTRNVMCQAMEKDLPRMEYYIEGKYVSAPGNIEKSLANFHRIIHDDASLLWLQQYIDSVSAFLHQGIFVDICESIPWWQDNLGARWDIQMISLNQLRSKNAFHINRHGVIKVIAQSSVSNLILKSGEIILTDSKESHLQMQVTLAMLKGGNGICMASNALNMADHAILTVKCQGKM